MHSNTPSLRLVAGIALVLCVPPVAGRAQSTSASGAARETRPWSHLTPKSGIPDDAPKPPFVTSARRLFTAPELLDAPDEWIDRSLQWVDYTLEAYKPSLVEHPLRRSALIRLDDVLHITSAPRKPIVQAYYRARMERVVAEIERTKITSGARIWKLYNHGFLVRTPTVSFTFDLVPGVPSIGFVIPPELLDRLVAQSDATFISHLHGDHANADVARRFLAAGKPVVAPEVLWKDQPELAKGLTVLTRSTTDVHDLRIQGGRQTLKVVANPGHQGAKILNNVTLVTSPEGVTVVQTGDQWQNDVPGNDLDWMSHVARDRDVDVLLPNCWTNDLDRMVRGIDPKLVITGHENEMGHTVPHREDYTQTYNRLFGIRYPAIVMTWGESFHYDRQVLDNTVGSR
jgi:L-ascorbate metabolism protein UlaG (beta-lactamase superfamily)